jgi:hypothetical protein
MIRATIAAAALVIAGSAPAAAPPAPVVRVPDDAVTARAVVRTDAVRAALGTHRRRQIVCRLAALDGGPSCGTGSTISTTEWTVIKAPKSR